MAKTRDFRPYRLFTDQHGRKYGATTEARSGWPCSPIDFKHRTPAGNLPPWMPDTKYLVFDAQDVGQVRIDYDLALADHDRALADWETLIRQNALAMYADKAGEQIERPGPGLLRLVGPKPAGRELIAACKAGNKWALGFTDAMPSWAAPVMATLRPVAEEGADTEAAQYPDADEEADDPILDKPKRSHHKRPAAPVEEAA